jgi:Calx-beta domain
VSKGKKTWSASVLLGLCLVLAGCGGDGSSSGGASTTSGGAAVPNPPTSPASSLVFSTDSVSVQQASKSATLSVLRSGDATASASVKYQTSNGSATSGVNYTAESGTLSWNAGDSAAKTIAVPLASGAFSGKKDFTVTLANPDGATVGTPASATVTINGSGAAATAGTIAFTSNSDTVAQSAGTVTISVLRSGGASGAASVAYTTQDGTAVAGTHYTRASGTLNWAAGDSANKNFAVTLSANAFGGTKNFTVVLSGVTGASLGSTTTATVAVSGTASAGTSSPAATLAAKLGKPSRFLVGIGAQGEFDPFAVATSQGLQVDIVERYLAGDWTTWNSPPCDYVCVVGKGADTLGAIPMFTQYQMANNGDGNLAGINDPTFMGTYWSRLKLMYQDIATYGKPVLVNFEPDFWGFVERQAPSGDPTKLPAVVSSNPDCSTLANDVTGLARCLVVMARKYAPKAYVGYPYSSWGGNSDAEVIAFMNAIGAQNADFIVQETSDRDAGCFEHVPQLSECARAGTGWYWDESNVTHPNFHDHFADVQKYHAGIGNLPIVWWQTPLGVPSTTAGGSDFHYRDNRVHYFLTHAAEMAAVGGLGVVFSSGEGHQTNVTTDGGQFQVLSGQYRSNPTPLP